MPVTTSLLISAGMGLAKAGVGAAQASKANKLRKGLVRPTTPTYNIPSAYKDALANAQAMAGQTQMPGQRNMEQKLGAQTASGMRAMTEGADSSAALMAGIGAMKGNQMAGQADINQNAMSYQDLNKQRLQSALAQYGGQQKQQFQMNEMNPYKDKLDSYNQQYGAAQGMAGAGMQNIFGGIDQVADTAGIAAGQFGGKKTMPNTGMVIDPKTGQPIMPQKLGLNFKDGGLVGKYTAAKRKGFKGNYKNWMTQNSSSLMQDFNLR